MKNYLLFLSFLIFILSCKKETTTKIDSNIIFSLKNEEKNSVLFLSSEKIYGSSGYTIDYKHSVNGDKIKIKLIGISEAHTALTVLSPATCKIDLGQQEKGDYKLIVKMNNNKTEGLISIKDSTTLTIGNNNIIDY